MLGRHLILAASILVGVSCATAAQAAKVGESCGGFTGARCDKGLWCDPLPGSCGSGEPIGTCVKVGRFCPQVVMKVCGCNGKTYNNDCKRQQQKVGKRHDGACY
jgi:hypothetical protein